MKTSQLWRKGVWKFRVYHHDHHCVLIRFVRTHTLVLKIWALLSSHCLPWLLWLWLAVSRKLHKFWLYHCDCCCTLMLSYNGDMKSRDSTWGEVLNAVVFPRHYLALLWIASSTWCHITCALIEARCNWLLQQSGNEASHRYELVDGCKQHGHVLAQL